MRSIINGSDFHSIKYTHLIKFKGSVTVTINTTKQPQYLPKISDDSATTVAFFELITLR